MYIFPSNHHDDESWGGRGRRAKIEVEKLYNIPFADVLNLLYLTLLSALLSLSHTTWKFSSWKIFQFGCCFVRFIAHRRHHIASLCEKVNKAYKNLLAAVRAGSSRATADTISHLIRHRVSAAASTNCPGKATREAWTNGREVILARGEEINLKIKKKKIDRWQAEIEKSSYADCLHKPPMHTTSHGQRAMGHLTHCRVVHYVFF